MLFRSRITLANVYEKGVHALVRRSSDINSIRVVRTRVRDLDKFEPTTVLPLDHTPQDKGGPAVATSFRCLFCCTLGRRTNVNKRTLLATRFDPATCIPRSRRNSLPTSPQAILRHTVTYSNTYHENFSYNARHVTHASRGSRAH